MDPGVDTVQAGVWQAGQSLMVKHHEDVETIAGGLSTPATTMRK
jgi:hypothetical protein